ncbi:MAG: hypothetical protein II720_03505 [Bacteroidales bacterium]|nr:hypothetical protein [Bacteroidales bacterium]
MLEDLKKNIERLIALYESEKQERLRLADELGRSLSENDTLKEQISALERQVDNLKLRQAFTSPAGGSESKEKMTRLIKEIDKCISLLEK